LTERHYWDTTTWIDLHNEPVTIPAGPCRTLWTAVEKGSIELLFSAITIAEVLNKPDDGSPRPWPDPNDFDKIFDHDRLVLVQVDRAVAERVRSIRRRISIKTPDAIHIACALHYNADQLISRDAGVLKAHGAWFRRDGKPLSVLTPSEAIGGPLFAP
jgi:predicted nucleic acid-binding protein